ncbi:MAG: DJ-1/PfpI family protein [Clostridia bacterium]|nr:DJ-1/PfpI family protein [Clostridia bacterium]
MYYMFLADGFEETEALVTLDMMRRANISTKTVGIGDKSVVGAHGICVTADLNENEVLLSDCDGIILPGGMPGTENLYLSETVISAVDFCKNGKMIAAICAAPIILGRKGLLKGKKAVCFPGFENELDGAYVVDALCVRDENIITAKGAGCVFEFSHEIISFVTDRNNADKVILTIQHKGL